MDHCSECGYDYGALTTRDASSTLVDLARRMDRRLRSAAGAVVATRSEPSVWSALEYACHLRDVLLVQRERILLAVVKDNPTFPPMCRDERVVLAGYGEQSREAVGRELVMAAELIARVIDKLDTTQMARPCVYNFPEAKERDVSWLVRHTTHEAVHHTMDVEVLLELAG